MNNDRRKSLNGAIDRLKEAAQAIDWDRVKGILEDAKSDIETIKDEEQEYYDNMPENMQGGEKGEKAQEAVQAMEDALSALEDAMGSDLVEKLEEAISKIEEATE